MLEQHLNVMAHGLLWGYVFAKTWISRWHPWDMFMLFVASVLVIVAAAPVLRALQ